jgi:hypothetical protein
MNPKPIRGELIVIVDKEDKYTHTIAGTDIKLFIDKDFGWNEREKNAVNAVVKSPGKTSLKEGTPIVCWHNSFTEHTLVDTIDTDEDSVYGGKKKLEVHILRPDKIFFYIENGNPIPMEGYLLVDRIYYKPKTELLYLSDINEQKENNRVVVKGTPSGYDIFAIGDVLITETMADYEVVYAYEGREHRIIRIKEQDIMAIDGTFKINETMRIGV